MEKNRKMFVPMKQRNQANARERDRTLSVNTAFQILRTLIPTEPKDRKLSKIETLRLATSYISHLATQLINGDLDQPCLEFLRNTSQVCTFCMALKKNKNQCRNVTDKEIYKNYVQMDYFYDAGSPLDGNQDFFQTYFV